MNAPKVFGIGFHKTGTTSLASALARTGYRVCDGAGALRQALGPRMIDLLHRHDLEPIFDIAERYEAFTDIPWFVLYRDLDRRFPGSKFILTIRDESRWLQSAVRYFGATESRLRRWVYGSGSPLGAEQRWADRYRQHNEEVQTYFLPRPRDLLVVDWEGGSGWAELSRFLGVEIPPTPFPHVTKDRTKLQFRNGKMLSLESEQVPADNVGSTTVSTGIDSQTVLVRSDALLYSELDGDVAMMSIETGKYYSLTSVGARIWALLGQPTSAAQICERLRAEYRVEADRCEADVLNILRRMADEGVVIPPRS